MAQRARNSVSSTGRRLEKHFALTKLSSKPSAPVASRGIPSRRMAFLFVALTATAIVAPMFFQGNASGHDFQFHAASWLDARNQWREGILFPRWAEWANWGFGEPRFIFYPPASWMLGAALGSVLPWALVPGAFIWLVLVAAGMTMWRLAREWLPGPQAVAAAVYFAANPYHLVIVYYRSDFAELLAGAFLPLVVLGTVRVARDGWPQVPFLAGAFAAMWLSNAPAAVIATYSLALLLPVGCIVQRSLRLLFTGGAAMAAGFGLAAFYILPAAWEQRWVHISQAISLNLHPLQNFLYTKANDPQFVLFNWKVSTVAMGVILLAAVAAVFAARRRREFPLVWWMLLALGAASVLLMFPPSIFLWRHLPKLQFVQFPWRWLEPVGLVLAFLVAAAGASIATTRRGQWSVWLVILVLFGGAAALMVSDAWWDSEDIPTLTAEIQSGHGYEGTDEYAPFGCDRYALPGSLPDSDTVPDNAPVPPPAPRVAKYDPDSDKVIPAAGVRIHITRWSAGRRLFSVDSPAPLMLAVRLINYPAWEVRVDGATARPQSLEDTAQMLVPLTEGAHVVEIHFRRTWDRTLGGAISLCSILALAVVSFFHRRKRSDLLGASANVRPPKRQNRPSQGTAAT